MVVFFITYNVNNKDSFMKDLDYTKDQEIHDLKSIIESLEQKLALFNVVGQSEQLADFKCPPNERCRNICDECAVANGLKQG